VRALNRTALCCSKLTESDRGREGETAREREDGGRERERGGLRYVENERTRKCEREEVGRNGWMEGEGSREVRYFIQET
jgi:hypothetical protein